MHSSLICVTRGGRGGEKKMSRQPDVWKCCSSSSKCCLSTHHNPSVPPSQGRSVLSPLPTNCCHGKWAKGHTETPVGCPLTKAYCSVNVEQIIRLLFSLIRIQSSHRIPFLTFQKPIQYQSAQGLGKYVLRLIPLIHLQSYLRFELELESEPNALARISAVMAEVVDLQI